MRTTVSDRLLLRPWRDEDADAIDHPIHGIWAITTAGDGRLVGNLLLKPIPLSAGEPAGDDTPNDLFEKLASRG